MGNYKINKTMGLTKNPLLENNFFLSAARKQVFPGRYATGGNRYAATDEEESYTTLVHKLRLGR